MARLSATAALLVLLLSLLAVAHCRPVEEVSATDAEPAAVVAAGDENGSLPDEAAAVEVVLPADHQQQHGFLRLPSHRFRHHRPCHHGLFHRHLWWARHHGAFGDAPRRFHRRGEVVTHLSPAGEGREVVEVKTVAEPDPDRSIPDSDGEGEVAMREPSFVDAREAAHEEEGAAVRAWRKEMQRRWFHHHHGMHLHRHHHDKEEEGHEQEEEAAAGLKHFHHHRRDEEENDKMRKRFRHAEHDDDSDDEDEEVEEMVRRFRKAIMRSRFGHGRRFHHHHHHGHRHAEEAEKPEAQEESGVVSWIKGFMNQF